MRVKRIRNACGLAAFFAAGLFLALAAEILSPIACRADDAPAKTPVNRAARPAAKPVRAVVVLPPLPAEREAAALAFAREQHPELATLIEKLRKENRRQFDRAIHELAQDRDRLVRLKKVAPAQYDLALAAWKLDSRAHLLAARMTMSQEPALETELKQILSDRLDVRLKQFVAERDRLQQRLAVLAKSIEKIEANKQAMAQSDLERIKRSVARSRRPGAKKPAQKETEGPGTERPGAARPIVAQRPQIPAEKSAVSATPPAKTKQD